MIARVGADPPGKGAGDVVVEARVSCPCDYRGMLRPGQEAKWKSTVLVWKLP